MATRKSWSKSYRAGYYAGKQGKRYPAYKWRKYSSGFKKGYSRGKSSRYGNRSYISSYR